MSAPPSYGQATGAGAYPQAPQYTANNSGGSVPRGTVGNAPYNPQPTYARQWTPPAVTHTQYGVNQKSSTQLAHGKKSSGCNDCGFAIVWHVQFIGMLGLCGYYIRMYKDTLFSGSGSLSFVTQDSMIAVGCLLVVGALCAIAWLVFMYYNAEFMVKCSIFCCLGMFVVAAGAFLIMTPANVGGAGLCVLIGAIFALYFWCVWDRVMFAAMSIKLAASAIHRVSATLWVAFFSIFAQIAWVLIWSYGALCVMKAYPDGGGGVYYVLLLYLIISFYWTAQQITSVVHSTVSGAVAMWYLFYGTNPNDANKGMPGGATCGALGRAMGQYFGSIAFGSFIIAIIKTIKLMLRYLLEKSGADFCACIVMCIMNCIDRAFQYFNHYTLIQVAVYGKTYCQAAKKTWALFSGEDENGNVIQGDVWDAVINDDLIGLVLGMSSLFSGLLTCVVGWALVRFVWTDLQGCTNVGTPLENCPGGGTYMIIGFIIGLVICMLVMTVVESAVSTIFVLYIEQPEALAKSKPQEAKELGDGWANIYGRRPMRNRHYDGRFD